MQPRQLLVLTLLVAVLGGFIFFYEKDLPSTEERAERAKKVLLLETNAIERVTLAWEDREVRLERGPAEADEDSESDGKAATPVQAETPAQAETWRITSPLDARADSTAVESLLQSLVDLESERGIEDFDRSELGLETPRAKVALHTSEGDTTLEIGAEIPATNDMIVGITGRSTAYQVASTIFEKLTQEPGDWRDRKLFLASRGEIERVTLEGSQRIELARQGDNFWLEAPLADRAEDDKVNGLLSSLTGLTVKTFVDDTPMTPEGLGLAPARGVIEVNIASSDQPFRFELGDEKESEPGVFYGRVGSQIFELETALADSLATVPGDWRSRSWTSYQVFKIETARFEGGDIELELTRDSADWRRGEDRIAYSTVSDVLYPITEAKGVRVLEPDMALAAGYNLSTPSLTISLTTKDSAETLELFDAIGGQVAATSEGREAVLLLPEDKVTEIHNKLEELSVAEPLPEEPEASEDTASESE